MGVAKVGAPGEVRIREVRDMRKSGMAEVGFCPEACIVEMGISGNVNRTERAFTIEVCATKAATHHLAHRYGEVDKIRTC
jgi:hypothetical protein